MTDVMDVIIDERHYQADPEVVKRMQEYYDTMLLAVKKLEQLEPAVVYMRKMQKSYFSTKDKYVKGSLLISSIQAEKEVDDILAGRSRAAEVRQEELFK